MSFLLKNVIENNVHLNIFFYTKRLMLDVFISYSQTQIHEVILCQKMVSNVCDSKSLISYVYWKQTTKTNHKSINWFVNQKCCRTVLVDRTERHDFWSRFLLFILLFFSPHFLGGKRKGKRITKVVVKSHAFLPDRFGFPVLARVSARVFDVCV